MRTHLSHHEGPMQIEASTIHEATPAVCLYLKAGQWTEITVHLPTAAALVAFGQKIAAEGKRLAAEQAGKEAAA